MGKEIKSLKRPDISNVVVKSPLICLMVFVAL